MPRDKIIYVVALELKMLYEENDNLCTLSRRRNHAATNQSKFECKVLGRKTSENIFFFYERRKCLRCTAVYVSLSRTNILRSIQTLEAES